MGINSKSASIPRGWSPAESHTGCGILHQTPQGHKDLRYLVLGALEPDTGSWHQIKFLDLALVSLALLSFLILTASQPKYDVGERKWWQLLIWGSESLPRLVQRACASYFPVGSGYLASLRSGMVCLLRLEWLWGALDIPRNFFPVCFVSLMFSMFLNYSTDRLCGRVKIGS